MSEQPSQYPPPYYHDDEITLKELILKVQEFGRELWSRKWLIFVLSGLGAAAFLLKASLEKTHYTAAISFMVSENEDKNQGSYSPFGTLDYAGVSNNKVTELARSGRIIYDVILSKGVLNEQRDFIGNHLINVYDLQEEWDKEILVEQYKNLALKDFYFTRANIDSFSQKEKRALSILHELVSGSAINGEKGIASISFQDESDIFKMNIRSLDENLSIQLLDAIFKELKDFYIEETVGKPQRAFELLEAQTDSLSQRLLQSERSLAALKDRNRNVLSSVSAISIGQREREVNMLSQEYESSLKSYKQLELLLSQETPEFEVIDRTFFPIKQAPSKVKAILTGLFLGGFLSGIWVIGRKIISDAMNS